LWLLAVGLKRCDIWRCEDVKEKVEKVQAAIKEKARSEHQAAEERRRPEPHIYEGYIFANQITWLIFERFAFPATFQCESAPRYVDRS
jgi:hypothetical protein